MENKDRIIIIQIMIVKNGTFDCNYGWTKYPRAIVMLKSYDVSVSKDTPS